MKQNREWLIEHACDSRPTARQMAAFVLARQFPLDGSEQIVAQLAQPMSIAEKRELFDGIYATAHGAFEEELCGEYRFEINASYGEEKNLASTSFEIRTVPLRVDCHDQQWHVIFFGKEWKGDILALTALRMEVRVAETGGSFEGFEFLDKLKPGSLLLAYEDESLQVQAVDVAWMQPESNWQMAMVKNDTVSPIGGGWSHAVKAPWRPPGVNASTWTWTAQTTTFVAGPGEITIEAEGDHYGLTSARWKSAGSEGFEEFAVRLVRVK
jgi:hypothetical protein